MKVNVHDRAVYAYTGGKTFDPALPCIVFLHGALHDHSVWTLLARWAAHHGHGVLALDEPAHGRSEGPPLPDVQSLADWTIAVLDAVGVKQAVVVGHSMGSLIALEAAARAPDRVSAIVMIATAFPMKVSQALIDAARDTPLKAIDMVNALSISTTASKPSFPAPGTWLHGANRMQMIRMQAGWKAGNLFTHDFSVCDRYDNGMQAAARVRCAATMVLGERDQMTMPRSSRELAQALHAQIFTLPGGHSLMQELPDAVLNALRSALNARRGEQP